MVQIRTGSVCNVGLAMKIDTTTSSHDARNEKMAAAKSPSLIAGKVTRSFTSSGEAPQTSAASSSAVSKLTSELLIEMIENGSAMIRWPITKPTIVPFRPILSVKAYNATASTTTGSTIGVRKNACTALRPRNSPRTSASDASRPIKTEKNVTITASSKLVSKEPSQPGSVNSWRYHSSVQPGGGKISHCESPNDNSTMNAIGSSRKRATAPPTAINAQRSPPKRSKSRSMSASSQACARTAGETELQRVQRERRGQQHESGGTRESPVQQ
ncbi:hypothetical protein X945_5583 [Burkholderia pseudomallei ABCPW 107]|nr:hypothetical protein DO64_5992 [Burkholderia pseudomallei]KGS36197.1 hypothetical protein X945_5583 [Burkholderia pseudomallei ABCPW 107]